MTHHTAAWFFCDDSHFERSISRERIHLRIQSCIKATSVAEAVLQELRRGKVETVVVGRRGVSKREEFLFGSVSNKIVREAKDCTVWVVE